MYRHGQEEVDAAARVLKSEHWFRYGEVSAGHLQEAVQFEAELAAWMGSEHACFTSSGTAALMCCYAGAGMGPGDEVIVPAFTAVPTAAAVCAAGAMPVLVDVRSDTATLDVDAARRARTDRPRAVVPVHLYGRPAELPQLGVPIVEDAAQAHGALDPTAPSAAAAYSFYPTKNLGGIGDGGAVVTDDDAIAARVRLRGRLAPEAVAEVLGGSGVFLMTSHAGYEGFPRVLVEALASGLPAVVTEGSDTGGMITSGENGLVTDRDPRRLAAAIAGAVTFDRHAASQSARAYGARPWATSSPESASRTSTFVDCVDESTPSTSGTTRS